MPSLDEAESHVIELGLERAKVFLASHNVNNVKEQRIEQSSLGLASI